MEPKVQNNRLLAPLIAVGALASAIAASSCCVLPLVFVSLGISGAWIGSLTALSAYQPVFMALAATSILAGFWVTRRANAVVCGDAACGTPASRIVANVTLWSGVVVLGLVATVEWWAGWLI